MSYNPLPESRLTDDPMFCHLFNEEFEPVYKKYLERSDVNLSEMYRDSVRRTVLDALNPRIRDVTAVPQEQFERATPKGETEFRDWLGVEIKTIMHQFSHAGVLKNLAA